MIDANTTTSFTSSWGVGVIVVRNSMSSRNQKPQPSKTNNESRLLIHKCCDRREIRCRSQRIIIRFCSEEGGRGQEGTHTVAHHTHEVPQSSGSSTMP
jgi:hypothetical protein